MAHRELWTEARALVVPLARAVCLLTDPPETLVLAVVASSGSLAATVLKTFYRTWTLVQDEDLAVAILLGTGVADFLWGYAGKTVSWPRPGEVSARVLIIDGDENGIIGDVPMPPKEALLSVVSGGREEPLD